MATLESRNYLYPYFYSKETEPREVTWLAQVLHKSKTAEQEFKLKSSDSWAHSPEAPTEQAGIEPDTVCYLPSKGRKLQSDKQGECKSF